MSLWETIEPLALVEELRAESEGRRPEPRFGFSGPYTDLSIEDNYPDRGKALDEFPAQFPTVSREQGRIGRRSWDGNLRPGRRDPGRPVDPLE